MVYVAIPLLAVLIGYGTRRLAIELMFRPVPYLGKRPLGWQGVVPRHAERIAATIAGLLMPDPREVFAGVEADRVFAEVEQAVLHAIDDIARDVLAERQPGVWEALPPMMQELAVKQMQLAAPRIVRLLVDGLREDAHALVDLRQLAVERLTADRARFTGQVRELVRPDLASMARTGLWLGAAGGLVEVAVWALTREPLLLPLFGAVIGLGGGWLAVRLVLLPRRPRTLQGRWRAHGSLHRRRTAVARQVGELFADEVLTPAALVGTLPGSRRALQLVAGVVDRVVDEQIRLYRPLVAATIGSESLDEVKRAAATRVLAQIPDTTRGVYAYLADATDIARLVEQRVRDLTPEEYELLLRPVFQRRQWTLHALGGLLGAAVGLLPVLLI